MISTVRGAPLHPPDPRRGACALIAIKARAHCKSRLARALTVPQRVQLARSMLAAVICAARGAQMLGRIVVLSPERDCVPAHVPVLADEGDSLNQALAAARKVVQDSGCQEIVVLPADLPDVTSSEIDALVRAGRAGGFAIAPDAAGLGTNALYLATMRPFAFQFGPDSRRLHLREAQRMGLASREVRLAGLQFDVDTPGDLHRLQERQWRARLQA